MYLPSHSSFYSLPPPLSYPSLPFFSSLSSFPLPPSSPPSPQRKPRVPAQENNNGSKVNSPEEPDALVQWREAVRSSTSASQLAVYINQLDRSIAWEKSPMKVVSLQWYCIVLCWMQSSFSTKKKIVKQTLIPHSLSKCIDIFCQSLLVIIII